MPGQLGNLVVRITTDLKGLNKGLGDARSQVARTTGDITRLTAQAGRSLTRLGLIAGAGLAAVVTASAKFENSFANVRKTIDATEKEFKQLEKNIRSLATTIPVGTTELNKIATVAGTLGIRGVDNITNFVTVVAKLSGTLDDLDATTAAKALADIANLTGESIENIDRLASVLTEAGNVFQTTEDRILPIGIEVAKIAKTIGLSAKEVLGFSTALAVTGARPFSAGTSLLQTFNALNSAVREGGKELRRFAEVVGITEEEFIKLADEDPAELFVKFTGALKEAGKDASFILKDLGLNSKITAKTLLGLANAEVSLKETLESANREYIENNALNEEAARKFATTTARLKIFINKIKDLAIDIGDTLKPAFDKLLEDFDEFLKKLKLYISANPEATAEFAKLSVKVTIVTLALGQLLKILALLPAAIKAIAVALQFLFGTPVGFVIFSIATAVILLVTALKKFKREYPLFSKFLEELAGAILTIKQFKKESLDFDKAVKEGIQKRIEELTETFNNVTNAIKKAADAVTGFSNLPGARLARDIKEREAIAPFTGRKFGEQTTPSDTDRQFGEDQPSPLGAIGGQLAAGPIGAGPVSLPAGEDDSTSFLDTLKEKLTEAKEAFTQFNTELKDEWADTGTSFVEVATQFTEVLTSAFGTAIADIVLGVTSAEEAFKQLANTAIRFLIEFAAKELANFVLRKVMAAINAKTMIALAVATGNAVAAAWAPAAALASLATGGGNAVGASAALTGVTALAEGLAQVPAFAEGGMVDRPTLAMVGEGGEREFIIPESKMGNMGTKVTMNNTFNVSSALDLDIITEKLGRDLERRDNEV